jgi:hypothetical protein
VRPLARLLADGMSRTERRYAEHLERLRLAGDILTYRFQPGSLFLGAGLSYRPDFLVLTPQVSAVLEAGAVVEVEYHEVKGGRRNRKTGAWEPYYREGARDKLYATATRYWWWRFVVAWPPPPREGVRWLKEEVPVAPGEPLR